MQSFGSETSRLEFESRYLALPIIRSKKEVDLFLARSPYNLLSIPGSDGTLHGKVVSMLTPGIGDALRFPRIEALAGQLGLSTETLRRRLRAESSSYTQIKSDLRRGLAYRLLAVEDMPINQVAVQIGFTESSSFVRAFKDWSGMTPLEYRRRLLTRTPST
jgi:AraC-like DNA-binding protein